MWELTQKALERSFFLAIAPVSEPPKSPVSRQKFLVGGEFARRQMFAAVIGAAIWIPYVLRSRRVANTFTQ